MSFNTIPVNGWPQLKELQELAEKVGNIPTFTSSDKEAIEDLISNAQALISVAEDGAAGVAFDNTGTDFESTNVQGAIEEAASMGGGVSYSTTETDTGKKWIDDSAIYSQLHILTTAVTPNTGTSQAWKSTGISTANMVNLIRADFYQFANDKYQIIDGIITNLNTQEDPNELSVKAASDVMARAIKAVYVEYTKVSS